MKLTNSQLNKLTKVYPQWLKDSSNSGLKQLPAIYHGVLGQVQLQQPPSTSMLSDDKFKLFVKQQNQIDYMNRFTDTERVQQLLSTSQLSNEILAAIWAHVNKSFPGKLTNREVCLALALIALFQKLERQQKATVAVTFDPFAQIKLEKKPPIPRLYPPNQRQQQQTSKQEKNNSNNSPLIEISNEHGGDCKNHSNNEEPVFKLSRLVSLIDIDGDKFEANFTKLTIVWLKFLSSMKALFKRTFDVLNVENSREGSIEALKSEDGQLFGKQLSACYPLAHNIKFKIDELNKLKFLQYNLFDEEYITQIDDLMTSINEYWAVLINLFHESGLTKFIETIMDGLNYKEKTIFSETIDELAIELDASNKSDTCSICHTKFYLLFKTCDVGLAEGDLNFLMAFNSKDLLTQDNEYHYHFSCANFWLNNVATNDSGLPFKSNSDSKHDETIIGILSPALLNELI